MPPNLMTPGTPQRGLLVFLHAFPLGPQQWQQQVAEFSPGWEVLVPPARGFDSAPPFDEPPAIDTLAHDLAALLRHEAPKHL